MRARSGLPCVALLAALAACTAARTWQPRAGIDEARREREWTECDRLVAASRDPIGGHAGMYRYDTTGPEDLRAACLREKGWVQAR